MNTTAGDLGYWRDEDLEIPTLCAACGTAILVTLYTGLEDREEGVPGSWNILRCKACGSLSLSPRPVPSAVLKAYRSYYTHLSPVDENRSYTGTSVAWRLIEGYLSHRFGVQSDAALSSGNLLVRLLFPLRLQLDYLYRHLSRSPGRLLDVGCGNGAFLLRAKAVGWDVQGVEPDAVAASQARAHGLPVFEGDINSFVPAGQYNVITLAHVVEHLHDPQAMLRACAGLLQAGGTLWIATPNIRSIGHRLFAAAWQPLETPRHLVMPSPCALRHMLRDAGFVNIRFIRRGRGSRKRLDASNRRAKLVGLRSRSTTFWSSAVDLYASFSAYGAEEVVVVASRPRAGESK